MKSNSFSILVSLVGVGCSLVMAATCAGQTPTINSQPQSVTVEYASDVSFGVTASGAGPLSYQWFKNGQALADFANVAGSTMPVLHLVGAAENDASTNYSVVISNQAGFTTSAPVALAILPSLKFADDFSSGIANWRPLMDSTALILDASNSPPVGGNSLRATNASQKMFHNLPVKYACRLITTFWIYDDGGPLAACGQLRGYSGPGYGKYASPGGLLQEMIIGKYNAAFGTNGAKGTLRGQQLNTNKYQGRILRGVNAGWFNLDAPSAPSRSIGWHKFQIDRAADGSPGGRVGFYVDGILAQTVMKVEEDAADCVVVGSIDTGNSAVGTAWFGSVTVQANPGLFDWQTLDSSGRELFPDWMKLREVGTNAQDLNVTVTTVAAVNGAATNNGLGNWVAAGNAMDATGLRGYLEYNLSAPVADAYRIEVEGREQTFQMPLVDLPLVVSVDGESLGRFNLPYGPRTNGFVHCFTPFLQPGSHIVRILWDNTSLYRKLHIEAIRLQQLQGGAVTSSGMKAWVANRLFAQCGVESAPQTSLVSPVCVEGRGRFLSMMSFAAGQSGMPLAAVTACPGAGNRWYANVPLSLSNETIFETSFQNGGLIETNQIQWVPDNLLMASNIMVRKGDSLLFTALPAGGADGQVTVNISGVGNFVTDASTPLPYQFNVPGSYTVTGTYSATGASGTITVQVVDASFEESPLPARIFKMRDWDCTNLPPQVAMDADPRLRLVSVSNSERAQQNPPLPPLAANEREYRVRITSAESPQYVLARLGPGGPVIASAAIQGFRWDIAPNTFLRQVAVNNDGSQVVATAFVMSPMMPTVTVGTQVIVSGVTFDDGTVTKTLSASDFDATGTCFLQFIRAAGVKASVCHTTHLYDGSILLSYQ